MLRESQVFVLESHVHVAVLHGADGSSASASPVALLASIHIGLVLLAVFALPTVLTSTWRPAVERAAQGGKRAAQANRLARHLFTTATTAQAGKEVRVTGIGERPRGTTPRRLGERGYAPVSTARWGSAMWHTLAWAIFGGAYVGAVVFVSSRPWRDGR